MVAAGKDRDGRDLAHMDEVQLRPESARQFARLREHALHRGGEIDRDENSFHGVGSAACQQNAGSARQRSSSWKRRVGPLSCPVQDLFSEAEPEAKVDAAAPLASRMRPRSLEEFVGQEHILAPGKLLRRAIEADRLPSVIFSGPPGTGKTTLAQIIAAMTESKFERLSGVESNVADMRKVVAAATNRRRTSGKKNDPVRG